MLEIERKFLVNSDDYKLEATSKQHIAQGYLSSVPERTVRVRIRGESGFLTIKGKSNETGTTRYEWETEIPLHEAKQLMLLCEPGAVEKLRYLVPIGEHTYEIDEFLGDNAGLVLAEIELSNESEVFSKPVWLGSEVTQDQKYYNSQLLKNPFKKWNK
ncbi:MAG: CYTH domain-containing protein [Flavobacterium sp.]|nr:CYTH domain-containing protein [Flavobacterium sp.]